MVLSQSDIWYVLICVDNSQVFLLIWEMFFFPSFTYYPSHFYGQARSTQALVHNCLILKQGLAVDFAMHGTRLGQRSYRGEIANASNGVDDRLEE